MTKLVVDDDVRLQAVVEANTDEMFRLVDRNRTYLREWLPWLDANRSAEDSRSFIRDSNTRASEGAGLVTAIFFRDQICGVAGFNWIDAANRACEIGYWISEDHQGRGIVTRSVRSLVGFAFDQKQLNRVTMPVAVGNTKSRGIPERLGFTSEGIRREAEWLYDHFVDHVMYAMLSADWVLPRDA